MMALLRSDLHRILRSRWPWAVLGIVALATLGSAILTIWWPLESGVVYVDGLRIGDTDPIVLRDRQKLANDGMVTAVAIVSLKHKKIEAIEFSGRGVSFAIDDQFSEDASASIMKTIEKGKFSFTSSGSDAIRKAVRDSLSNFIWSRTRTRPMIIPVVMEV